jgi:hypothetical protein
MHGSIVVHIEFNRVERQRFFFGKRLNFAGVLSIAVAEVTHSREHTIVNARQRFGRHAAETTATTGNQNNFFSGHSALLNGDRSCHAGRARIHSA